MPEPGFDTPVIFMVFNRPDLTARVFEQIARIRPRTLYVIADGPRADRPGDVDVCAATRKVVEQVDWPCEVIRDYSEENLGCGLRCASGLTNAFDRLDRAIVLEDDCLPDPSFFGYCEALLVCSSSTPIGTPARRASSISRGSFARSDSRRRPASSRLSSSSCRASPRG